MVPGEGVEPTRITPADFKSAASANSATPAPNKIFYPLIDKDSTFLAFLARYAIIILCEDL